MKVKRPNNRRLLVRGLLIRHLARGKNLGAIVKRTGVGSETGERNGSRGVVGQEWRERKEGGVT